MGEEFWISVISQVPQVAGIIIVIRLLSDYFEREKMAIREDYQAQLRILDDRLTKLIDHQSKLIGKLMKEDADE